MTTYKEIFGKQIKQLSTDPTDAGAEGQVWYNSTSGTFKTVLAVGAWSSGGTANVVAYNLGGAGTNTAALTMGGANSTGSGSLTSTEEYNGSAWTAVTGLPGGVSYTAGCGVQTAALLAGGANIPAYASTNSYEYDGTNWSSGGTMNTATGATGQVIGIQTAALISGGDRVPGAPRTIANAEEYNGSAWTSVTSLPAVRQYQGTAGIQTAGVLWGGYADTNPGTPNTQYTTTLEYDGTNWTTGGTIPAARKSSGGSGTQSDALAFGGNPGTTPTNLTTVLNYNGTSWAANPASLASGRQSMASSSSGPSTAAFAAKGSIPAVTATMEVYNVSIYSPIAATWAAGGNLPTKTNSMGSFGSQTAALAFNGEIPGAGGNTTQQSVSYDGTSWTATNPTGALTTSGQGARGAGTTGAGIASSFQGGGGTPSAYTDVKNWDGTNWSAGTSHSNRQSNAGMASAGTQTATAIFGGSAEPIPGPTNLTEEWDGSSWTGGGNMNTSRTIGGGSGTVTAALAVGGSSNLANEEYNGSSWTSVASYPAAPAPGGAGIRSTGTQDETLAWINTVAATYNGTSWTTVNALATSRNTAGGAGTQNAALAIGGTPNDVGGLATEEFTGEIPALNYKTLTSS